MRVVSMKKSSEIIKKHKRLIKTKVKTNPDFGKKPQERSINELIECGFIVLDKPNGPTSHQVDSWIKEILSVEKVGHSGTLDPNATGILPIGVGDATKILSVLLKGGKEYVALMMLHKKVDDKKIISVCKNFVGEIVQLPPLRSAVRRVHRKRRIYYLKIIQINDREVLFRVGCESGTYVRTLCVDIGKKLGCGAHLAELRRTKVCHLNEDDCVYLQDVKDGYVFYKEGDEKYIRKVLHPVEKMLEFLPKIIVRDSAIDAICHGANLAIPGVVEVDTGIMKNDIIGVFSLKGEAIAIATSLMSTEEIIEKDKGFCSSLVRVIMKKDVYPSIWKKS
jgi:H/ACA ribonucleoprotein complex subunit 4